MGSKSKSNQSSTSQNVNSNQGINSGVNMSYGMNQSGNFGQNSSFGIRRVWAGLEAEAALIRARRTYTALRHHTCRTFTARLRERLTRAWQT